MRISNTTDEQIAIEPGEHVDVKVAFIRKNGGKIVESVIEEIYD